MELRIARGKLLLRRDTSISAPQKRTEQNTHVTRQIDPASGSQ